MNIDEYILRLNSWRTPATNYPENEVNGYRIHRTYYGRGLYDMSGIDNYVFFKAEKPLTITTLQQFRGNKWYQWMVDDPPHWRAMEIYSEQSSGKVLTTGLGLGLIVHGLTKNLLVDEIVVVECSPEVIKLISPLLPENNKLSIITADFYDYLEHCNTEWDTIIVDLWVSNSKEQKLDIFFHNVIPTAVMLRQRYPNASITFHGFWSISDIKFTSKEMVDLVLDVKERVKTLSFRKEG